jgi:hypothetical protein
MGLVDEIKSQAKKAGTNKGKFTYFKSGVKIRGRFLQDMEDGVKIPFHDSFALGINVPCQKLFGKKCKHCDNDELRHRDQYAWSWWNQDSKQVEIVLGPVNNASPVPGLVNMFEAYGTLTDRDYVITQNGSGATKTFGVVPMDKAKFRNEKAKPFSKTKILELVDKAFPDDDKDDDDDDDDSGDKAYDEMSPKELYALCKERDIEAKAKQPKKYYVDLLEAADAESDSGDDDDGWGDDDDGDKPDYSSMSPKELYSLCKERDIDAEPKKPATYYIEKLEANDLGDASEDDGDDW